MAVGVPPPHGASAVPRGVAPACVAPPGRADVDPATGDSKLEETTLLDSYTEQPNGQPIKYDGKNNANKGEFVIESTLRRSTGRQVASAQMPPLPGAQITSLTRGDCCTFHASACSRPPLPMMRIFMSARRVPPNEIG